MFKVTIKLASMPDLHHLMQFLSGRHFDMPYETVQALDLVMREKLTAEYAVLPFYTLNDICKHASEYPLLFVTVILPLGGHISLKILAMALLPLERVWSAGEAFTRAFGLHKWVSH